MKCPEHGTTMIATATKYGNRHHCPVQGCTWVWWDNGKVNSPANAAMRAARQQAHAAFDPLWRSKQLSRNNCYSLLAEHLGKPAVKTHIGLFTVEECQQVISFAATATQTIAAAPRGADVLKLVRQALNLKEPKWPRSTK